MEKAILKNTLKKDNMKVEYDFYNMKGSVRWKYYKAYRAGHKVKIHHSATKK